MNWEEIGRWFFVLALIGTTLAGFIKAVEYLAAKGIVFVKERRKAYMENKRVEAVLNELTDSDGWPNGSDSLMESHRNLYSKVGALEEADKEIMDRLDDLKTSVDHITDAVNNKE